MRERSSLVTIGFHVTAATKALALLAGPPSLALRGTAVIVKAPPALLAPPALPAQQVGPSRGPSTTGRGAPALHRPPGSRPPEFPRSRGRRAGWRRRSPHRMALQRARSRA